jgi:hypothetical protein
MRRIAAGLAPLVVLGTAGAGTVAHAQATSITVQNVVRVTIPEHVFRGAIYQAPAPRAFAHHERLTSTFDAIRNETAVAVSGLRLTRDLSLGATFWHAGAEMTSRPFFVRIAINLDGDAWAHALDSAFVLTFEDGTQLSLGRPVPDSSAIVPGGGRVLLDLSLQVFLRVVQAKQVIGSLAGEQFAFSEEQLEALRDLASRTLPPVDRLAGGKSSGAAVGG